MSYVLTSATDMDDLVDKIHTFGVTTDGAWTSIYNEDLADRQIGIEVSNCHIGIGSTAADKSITEGAETDGKLSAALSTSLTVGNKQFWGHPGSIVTTSTDLDRVICNDLGVPTWSNVWFFSGTDLIAESMDSVAAGGSSYAVSDTITLTGGTFSVATVLVVDVVSAGAVTAASIVTPGNYTTAPGDPVAQGSTSGSGTGATFNMTYSSSAVDVDYIHVVIQSSAERYTHFSFGIIDGLGQSTADVAFACGMNYEWFISSAFNNNPTNSAHRVGYLGGENSNNTFVPASVLPAGYPASAVFNRTSLTPTMTRGDAAVDHYNNGSIAGKILDFFLAADNQLTTGGTALHGLPWLFREADGSSHVWLGNLPGMRLVNISNEAPGTEITQGSDTWVVFPWKRKGLRGDLSIDIVNTIEYGFAYKKNV